jgi:hypothetical protein
MKAIQVNGAIKKFASLPKVWTDENGTHLNITDGEAYGFYDVTTPDYNSATQFLGNIVWNADTSTFTYLVEDKTWSEPLDELKQTKISELKNIYNRKLVQTDWYIIRAQEGTAAPQSILDDRSDLRVECAAKETEINGLTTKSEIASYSLPNLD